MYLFWNDFCICTFVYVLYCFCRSWLWQWEHFRPAAETLFLCLYTVLASFPFFWISWISPLHLFIFFFINILKLICFLYSFVIYLFITILNLFVYKFAFKDPTFPGAYMSYPWLFSHFLSSFLLFFFNYVFCICILCCWCIFCDFLHYVYTL